MTIKFPLKQNGFSLISTNQPRCVFYRWVERKHDDRRRSIVHHIDLLTQIDDYLQFLDQVEEEQVLIITSDSLDPELFEQILYLQQFDELFIRFDNSDRYQYWASKWSKIHGVYNRIKLNCEPLRAAVKQTNENLIPISFVTQSSVEGEGSTNNLNRLEPSFIYTTLLKRILLTMGHASDEKKEMVKFCRIQYADNPAELKMVEEFNREYRPDKAIWWHTRECFINQMLHGALRLLESDIIVDMSFFIQDLHRQLQHLYREQIADYQGKRLTLYRGQALCNNDLSKWKSNRGGLVAFTGFLLTTTTKSVSLEFARENSTRDNLVGVLFVMIVDSTIPSAIFANIGQHSFFAKEHEILFSMNTVFRIDEVLELDAVGRLYEAHLTMTGEDDPELRPLTDQIRISEIFIVGIDWDKRSCRLDN